jgi:tRNA threonylcarbamoyladenosine biosynthesis protein TsaE
MEWKYSLEELPQLAKVFWENIGDAKVLAFHGNLGSGKTTFIHALCDAKNVKDIVGSPTFAIINEYVFEENGKNRKLFHIDLYRMKDEEEARVAGVEDCLFSGNLCLVEWPEKVPGIFPDGTIHIFIEPVNTNIRKLRIGGK